MRFLSKLTVQFIFILLLPIVVLGQQINIPRVEEMPNFPAPYQMRDWKAVAIGYDSFVFDFDQAGQYLPLIFWNTNPVNYPGHSSFGLHTVVGTPNTNHAEAINVIPAVVGASLVGIDKSDQDGNNWVLMCEEFFNNRPEENVYLNGFTAQSGSDWWYDTMPNIFFYQLYDLYPGTGDFDYQLTSVADQWLEAVNHMGASTTPWHVPYMHYRAWSLSTMTPLDEGVREPESAGAIAWLLYNAYVETGNEEYRIGAEHALEFLDSRIANPSYEIQMPYGAYVAARMNAEIGTDYDIEQMVNWCFETTQLRGWGCITGTWGDYSVDGLIGEDSGNEYAFMMNGYEHAGALVPLVRYDERFARAIGKWVLNLANSSRLFYTNFLDDDHQDSEDWSHEYDPDSYIGHEAMREELYGYSPFATGDAIAGGWGATNLVLYGSSHVGILGAIVDTTDVSMILSLNVNATDYFSDFPYDTRLVFNPYESTQTINISFDEYLCDVYDVLTNDFIQESVQGDISLSIPADAARLLVFIPSDADILYDLNHMYVDGSIADYDIGQPVDNHAPRIKSLASNMYAVQREGDITLYCTAMDLDNDDLDYEWSCESGVFSGTGTEVTWTAPDQVGDFIIECSVNDGDLSDTENIEIHVAASLPPEIQSLTAEFDIVDINGSTSITCIATDDMTSDLIYNWTCSGGVISGEGETVSWEAPGSVGVYDIVCTVEDEHLLTDSETVQIVAGYEVLYLPCNNSGADISGFDNDAQVNGAVGISDRNGNTNQALSFDGDNDYLNVSMNQSLNFGAETTISLWMKADQLGDREYFLISHGSWENRWKISIIPDGNLRWTVKTDTSSGNGIRDLDSETLISENHWYFVTVTFGQGQMKVYLDGQLNSSTNWGGDLLSINMDLTIGQMLPGNNTYNFDGRLDEVRIFNRVLSDAEIQANYELSAPTHVDNNLPASFSISNVYPNPFNSSTRIKFDVPFKSDINLNVYNINGQLVETLISNEIDAGYHIFSWNADKFSSGIYFIKLQSAGNTSIKKCILVK